MEGNISCRVLFFLFSTTFLLAETNENVVQSERLETRLYYLHEPNEEREWSELSEIPLGKKLRIKIEVFRPAGLDMQTMKGFKSWGDLNLDFIYNEGTFYPDRNLYLDRFYYDAYVEKVGTLSIDSHEELIPSFGSRIKYSVFIPGLAFKSVGYLSNEESEFLKTPEVVFTDFKIRDFKKIESLDNIENEGMQSSFYMGLSVVFILTALSIILFRIYSSNQEEMQ